MAVINTIASKSAGCGGESMNTGDLGCDVEFGLVIHALGFRKGIRVPAATDFTKAYIDGLVQSGDVIPLMDAFSSEPTIAEDVLETSPLGVEALALKGLPKYMLTMKKGQHYYKEMAKLTGFGNINWVLGDVNGNWKFAVDSAGDFTGFTAGQTLANITVPATATETEKKSVTFQLTDRNQIDIRYAVILASNAFPISDVTGVNGALLSYADSNGVVVPASGDTTLKVKVLLESDLSTEVEGLVASDFKYTVDGVVEVPTLVENGDGFYTLTITALASSTIIIQLYDSNESKKVIISNSELYTSNVLTEVIA